MLGCEPDLADTDLIAFALSFAGVKRNAPVATRLLEQFGDLEIVLASDADELRARGGLADNAVAVLKLVDGQASVSQIARTLGQTYDADPAVIEADILVMLADLAQKRVLER